MRVVEKAFTSPEQKKSVTDDDVTIKLQHFILITTSYQCCNREGAVTTVTTSAHNVMVQGRAPNENIV